MRRLAGRQRDGGRVGIEVELVAGIQFVDGLFGRHHCATAPGLVKVKAKLAEGGNQHLILGRQA